MCPYAGGGPEIPATACYAGARIVDPVIYRCKCVEPAIIRHARGYPGPQVGGVEHYPVCFIAGAVEEPTMLRVEKPRVIGVPPPAKPTGVHPAAFVAHGVWEDLGCVGLSFCKR